MIKVDKNEGTIISGTILDMMGETTALLRVVKEFLTDKLGEKAAAFCYSEILKFAEMTDDEFKKEFSLMLNKLLNILVEKG